MGRQTSLSATSGLGVKRTASQKVASVPEASPDDSRLIRRVLNHLFPDAFRPIDLRFTKHANTDSCD